MWYVCGGSKRGTQMEGCPLLTQAHHADGLTLQRSKAALRVVEGEMRQSVRIAYCSHVDWQK